VDSKPSRLALKNVFNFLKPNGACLLTIVVKHILFEIYHELAKQEKYREFMDSFKGMHLTSHYEKNPIEKMERYLREVGFPECQIELQDVYTSFKNFEEFIGILELPSSWIFSKINTFSIFRLCQNNFPLHRPS
jgi:hypothetical protein